MRVSEEVVWMCGYDILRALEELHGGGCVHLDVKSANVFVGGDGLVKLGDFGAAVILGEG